VTLNFHPDREADGVSVLEALRRDASYRCQFETGSSNGALTAYPGGTRWLWEQRMFGHAYDNAPASERPKYGALNHRRRSIGGAPRFGSSHIRLAEHILDRTTFCFPDSVLEPTEFGTAERFDLLRLADAYDRRTLTDSIEADEGGRLDDYVEAHVHGEISLERDVDALVLDPSFRDTPIERCATSLDVPLEWHEGRRLSVDELGLHPDFRGQHVIDVGRRIAVNGLLDAYIVGLASHVEDPQDLKLVWHCVARFGKPIADR
jgi:hypothetical protein